MPEPSALNLIDVFAGVGGFTLGFLDPGGDTRYQFTPRLLVDTDREARDVVLRNLPGTRYLVEDVHNLSGGMIRQHAGLTPSDPIHLLLGGPPCQGFSWLGKRALNDPRNVHLLDFVRLVRELRPLVAIIENVPLIVTSHNGAIRDELIHGLHHLGYEAEAAVLLASEYGVPQYRKRAFVLAYRRDLGVTPRFPERTHERIPSATSLARSEHRQRLEPNKAAYVSVEEAIGDLPAIAAGGGAEVLWYQDPPTAAYQHWVREGSIAVFNHRSRDHSPEFLAKIARIREGGRNKDLPPGQRFSEGYFSQAYARLHRHGIAQTVTTYFGNPGSGRFIHFKELRSLTVREAARFQSFQDWFLFEGLHATQMRHVGNAVPPLLARAIRNELASALATAGFTGKVTAQSSIRPQESTALRSRIMRSVPGRNTATEVALRHALRRKNLRGYRLHHKGVPGTPDVVFSRRRVAVFVDGCFWHGCPQCYREPQSRREYWRMKVRRNRDRDARVNAACADLGWRVVRVWEHDVLKRPLTAARAVARVLARAVVNLRKSKVPGGIRNGRPAPVDWHLRPSTSENLRPRR